MSKTVPNQNIVIVKKTPCKANFLQVNNDEWMTASIACGKSFNAFKLYLYLAANEIGYEKALSQQAIENSLKMKSTSYYDSIAKLKELGYIRDIGGNKFEFYTTPFRQNGKVENDILSVTAENKMNDLNSVLAESNSLSAQAEKVDKNLNSATAENSVETEKVYQTFNF